MIGEEEILRTIAAVEQIQAGVSGLSPELAEKLVMERDLPAAKRGGLSSDDAGEAIFIIGDPPAFDPWFAELLLTPALISSVQELLGTDAIRYHFSNITMKRSRIGSGISWHRDFPNRYLCPRGASFGATMTLASQQAADQSGQ